MSGGFGRFENAPRGRRIAALDATRGLAVVAMIQWHAADAWLGDDPRRAVAFVASERMGGLAAPAFFFLAGASLALGAPSRPDPAWLRASLQRGARIVLGGYALNLWAWVVDHAAWLQPANRVPALALAAGLALLAAALGGWPRAPSRRAVVALAGLLAIALAWLRLPTTTRLGERLLARLDVLHGIGAAVMLSALLLHALAVRTPRQRAVPLALAAIVLSSLSVVAIGAPQTLLPSAIADWVARRAPGPTPATSFPLLPWLPYTLLGAAIASARRDAPMEHRWALPGVARAPRLGVAALALAALWHETSPPAQAVLDRLGELRSLSRLVSNVALIIAAASTIAWLAPRAERTVSALALLGRHSLLVYCVHLEFVFGLAGVPWRRALGWGSWSLGVTALLLAMCAVAGAAERRRRRTREKARGIVHAAA